MKRSYIAYRCQLCGEVIVEDRSSVITSENATSFCSQVIKNQQMWGNPYLYKAPMYMVHHCSDDSCGIAQFVGVKLE